MAIKLYQGFSDLLKSLNRHKDLDDIEKLTDK